MTVEEAIEELKGLAISTISSKRERALSIAISALEKEKEPQPEQADKDSLKNNSIKNDNTKLKECQEVIDLGATALIEYYNHLSKEEQKAWDLGEVYRKVLDAQNLLEEEKQCQ